MAKTPDEDIPASRLEADSPRPPSAGCVLTNAREACNRSMMFFQHCRKAYTQLQHEKQSLLKIQYGDAYNADELLSSPRGSCNRSWHADSRARPRLRGDVEDPSYSSLVFASTQAPIESGDSTPSDSPLATTDEDEDDVSAPPDSRLGPCARRALQSYRRHMSAPANQEDTHAVTTGVAGATASAYPSSALGDLPSTSSDEEECSPCGSWTPRSAAAAAAAAAASAQPARASKATCGPSGVPRAWAHHVDSPTPTCEMVQDGPAALTVRRSHTAAHSFLTGGLVARPHPPNDSDRRRPQRPHRRSTADGPIGSASDLRVSTSEGSGGGGGGGGSRRYGGGAAAIRGRVARATDTAGNTNTDVEDSDGACTGEWLLPPSHTAAVGHAGAGRKGPPLRPSCHPASRYTSTAAAAATATVAYSARRRSVSPGFPGAAQHLDEQPQSPSAAAASLPSDPAAADGSDGSRSASPPPTAEGKRERSKPTLCMTRNAAMSYLILSADRPPWRVSKPDKPPSRQRRQDAAELRSLSLRRMPIRSGSPAVQSSPSGVGGVGSGGGGGGAGSCTTPRPNTAERSWHSFTSTAAVMGSHGGAAATSLTSRVNRSAGSARSLSALANRRTSNTVVPHSPAVPHAPIDAAPLLGKDRQGRLPALDSPYCTLGTAGQMRNSRRSLDEANLDANRGQRLGQAATSYSSHKGGGRGVDGGGTRGFSDNGVRQPARGGRTAGGAAISSGGGAAVVHARFASALHTSTGGAAGDDEAGNGKDTLMTRLFKALHDLRRADTR